MFHPSLRMALAALERPATLDDWLCLVQGMRVETGFWWLDSALPDARLGRYSFAGADPYLCLEARRDEIHLDVRRAVWRGLERAPKKFEGDPFEVARSLLPRTDSLVYSTRSESRLASTPEATGETNFISSVPSAGPSHEPQWHEAAGLAEGLELPFLGGAVGYFGYELASRLEPGLDFGNADDLGLPDLSLSFVDQLLAFDHESERLWIIGLGFGESRRPADGDARELSVSRSRDLVDALSIRVDQILANRSQIPEMGSSSSKRRVSHSHTSTVDASGYAKAVDTILEEIESGNVYQANYSQRLTVDADLDPWTLYQALRKHNAAPFGAYLKVGESAILSSSPERFLQLDESRHVESRPIKGTRPRGRDEAEDALLRHELAESPKDRAENLMIVDLVRNDLGRVCAPASISVPELMTIEAYAEVFQMVSTVTGSLASGRDGFDLLRATFPPGSMTGAPKIAAIGLLERLEKVRRGIYAGALGYLDLRGGLDLSVVIRTIVWRDGRAHLHVGGGIVADSTPEGEYLESLDKAKAPLAALDEVLDSGET